MKLLFDENLSPRLIEHLAAEFPGSSHVELIAMRGATDAGIIASSTRMASAAKSSSYSAW